LVIKKKAITASPEEAAQCCHITVSVLSCTGLLFYFQQSFNKNNEQVLRV
jgi:hypothetical protein